MKALPDNAFIRILRLNGSPSQGTPADTHRRLARLLRRIPRRTGVGTGETDPPGPRSAAPAA